jgi:hypothetical protein
MTLSIYLPRELLDVVERIRLQAASPDERQPSRSETIGRLIRIGARLVEQSKTTEEQRQP